jgi:GTP cyclohydrolase II
MTNATFSVQPAARDARSFATDTDPVRASSNLVRMLRSANGQSAAVPAVGNGSTALKARTEAPIFSDVAHTVLPMEFQGQTFMMEAHAYEDDSASYQAMALVYRKPGTTQGAPFVRVHSGCVTGDIFHSLRCDCYQQLQKALETVVESQNGIILYFPYHEGRGIGLVAKLKAYAEQDRGLDTVDANIAIGAPVDSRDYELAGKILRDLDVTDIRLLTNNPLKVEAMKGYGINVVEQVPHITEAQEHNERYLNTKRERMAHTL